MCLQVFSSSICLLLFIYFYSFFLTMWVSGFKIANNSCINKTNKFINFIKFNTVQLQFM